jgi:hypothetical protein
MSRMIIAACAFALAVSSAQGEASKVVPPAAKPLLDAYETCVTGNAKSLAGSPDSAEAIVKSAIGSCGAEQRALSEALRAAGLVSDELNRLLQTLDQQVTQAGSRALTAERDAH